MNASDFLTLNMNNPVQVKLDSGREAYEAPVIHSVDVAVERGFSLYPPSLFDPDDDASF